VQKSSIRADIQGLRGISILSVILYHGWPRLVPGGFVGVDIFFVISGFVITNTILRDYSLGEFSILSFYRRRVRRIFPALYTVLAFAFLGSWFVLSPRDFQEFARTALSAVCFSSNFVFLRLSGYFGGLASLKPLLHTWSLSVEEQFYVLYPISIVLIHRYFPRSIRFVLVVMASASLVLSMWMVKTYPNAAFYLAPPRAFELLLGGIIASPGWSSTASQRSRNYLSFVGLTCIAIALAAYNQRTTFPGASALLPCLGAALIIWAGTYDGAPSFAARVLSAKPFTLFGNLSYSLYLWHWPILVFAQHCFVGKLSSLTKAACLGTAVVASALSLHFIERPFLDKRRESLPYLRIGLGMVVCASLLCLAVLFSRGVPQRFSPGTRAIFAASDDYNHRRAECHSSDRSPIPYDKNCIFGAAGASPDIAVWGDSHGAELVVALGERLAREGRSAMEITSSACPPATNFNATKRPNCRAHNDEILRRLIADKRIRTVVLAANFSGYRISARFDDMLAGYRHVVESLHANGKRIVLVYPIPTYDFDPPSVLGMRAEAGMSLDEVGMAQQAFRESNQRTINLLDSLYAEGIGTRVIPEELLCASDRCRVYSPQHGVLYFNGQHLSVTGARIIVGNISL
jgi:peptidoglycan/LPS O-acetylase OafA/YrhL